MVGLTENYTNFCFTENQSLSGTILAEQCAFKKKPILQGQVRKATGLSKADSRVALIDNEVIRFFISNNQAWYCRKKPLESMPCQFLKTTE